MDTNLAVDAKAWHTAARKQTQTQHAKIHATLRTSPQIQCQTTHHFCRRYFENQLWMRTWRSTRRLGTPPRESKHETQHASITPHYEHQPRIGARKDITSEEDTSRTSCGYEPGGQHAGLAHRRAKANTNLERQDHTTLRTSTNTRYPTTHHFCRRYFENQLWIRTWRSTRRLGTPPRESSCVDSVP